MWGKGEFLFMGDLVFFVFIIRMVLFVLFIFKIVIGIKMGF